MLRFKLTSPNDTVTYIEVSPDVEYVARFSRSGERLSLSSLITNACEAERQLIYAAHNNRHTPAMAVCKVLTLLLPNYKIERWHPTIVVGAKEGATP